MVGLLRMFHHSKTQLFMQEKINVHGCFTMESIASFSTIELLYVGTTLKDMGRIVLFGVDSCDVIL